MTYTSESSVPGAEIDLLAGKPIGDILTGYYDAQATLNLLFNATTDQGAPKLRMSSEDKETKTKKASSIVRDTEKYLKGKGCVIVMGKMTSGPDDIMGEYNRLNQGT